MLAGAFTAYTFQPAAEPLNLIEVADNFHVIEGSGGNVSVYATGDGAILVDDKFERNFEEIISLVESVTDEPIKYVINTHNHGDHVGGNAKMLPRAEVIAHKNARANMVRGNQPGLQRVTFSEEMELHLADKMVVARYFGRSHTSGDVAVYFPEHKLVAMGDMGANNGPNVDYNNGGSFLDWSQTINGMLEWDIETVVPGHGPVSPRQYAVDYRNRVEQIRQRVWEMMGDGQGREAISSALQQEFDLPANHNVITKLDGIMGELLASN